MSDSKEKLPSEGQLTKQYGKGFNMLKKMGFKTGTGLGPNGEGITAPIEISMRRPGTGLRDDEGAPKPTKRKRKGMKTRKVDSQESESGSGGSDVDMEEDYSSSGSEDGAAAPQLSENDIQIAEARRAVEKLNERRREIDFKLFSLNESMGESVGVSELDGLLHDLFESDLLSQGVQDFNFLAKALDLLRDKYESNPLWYELDVELLFASFVSEAITLRTEHEEISPDLILSVREMILDDDHFARLLEFQLLPPLALRPNLSLFQAINECASPLHYQSIYSRFLEQFFIDKISKQDFNFIVSEGWVSLVPSGPSLRSLLTDHVKPRLVSGSSPEEIIMWRKFFSPEDWKDVLHHLCLQILTSLKRVDPDSPSALDIIQAAIAWAPVVGACTIGLLLTESQLLLKWFEKYKKLKQDSMKQICKKWLIVLAPVAYHSPARKIVIDALKLARGETGDIRRRPGGPPKEFFANAMTGGQAETARANLGDVIKERCLSKNITFAPKPGAREAGAQVYRIGPKTVYWKEDGLFEKISDTEWPEIGIESLFRY
jgi:hypothetical protein